MITDRLLHAPPAIMVPSAGTTYTDPIFGTPIKRITDAVNTRDNADGTKNLSFIVNEYPPVCPFNKDGTLLLLQHQGYYGLYTGDGHYLDDLPREIIASGEPRWSRTDPRVVYFKAGNTLKACDVLSKTIKVVRVFSEYYKISGRGESDMCWDGDHIVLVGDDRYIFVYTISTGTKGAWLDTNFKSFDSVYISADDQVTVTWAASGTGRLQGIELFDKNMKFLRQIARAGGHMDMGRDTNGDAVAVWASAADPTPLCPNGVVKIRLADGKQTCLLTPDWNLAFHISCDDNGHALVSTYRPDESKPWAPYTNELIWLTLDGSAKPERLAHHRSLPFNTYNWQSKASVSRDGSKIVFSSNFGVQGVSKEYADVYLITRGAAIPPPPAARNALAEIDAIKVMLTDISERIRKG